MPKTKAGRGGGVRPGLPVDEDGLLVVDGSRNMVVPALVFHELRRAGVRILGRGYWGIAYQTGEALARRAAAEMRTRLGASADSLAIVRELSGWARAHCWGRDEIVSLDLGSASAVVRTHGCAFDAPDAHGRDAECPLSCGFWAGILEVLSGRPTLGEETRCISKGDPYCEFTVGPAPPGGPGPA